MDFLSGQVAGVLTDWTLAIRPCYGTMAYYEETVERGKMFRLGGGVKMM